MTKPKRLGVLPLAASTFFMVSGGAYGLEELVSCGYGVALATLVATPFLWSLPTALMVGELASALPEEGGYYAWVRRALGPFWGFQEAWLSLVASVFDMAIYPTLFTAYVDRVFPSLAHGVTPVGLGVVIIAACAGWNLRGAATVGSGSITMALFTLAPFAAFTLLAGLAGLHGLHGLPALPAAPAAAPPSPAHGDLLAGVLIALWNYMGWDNASTIAGEVRRPAQAYPRAVFATLALVAASYVLPVGAAALAGLDPTGWTTGSWVDAARDVGGSGLALAVVAGGTVCGVGMFNALLLSYSRLPAVLAEDGYLPSWLARRGAKSGAPWAAVAVCSVAYAACLGLGFRRLVNLDILLYGTSLILEFAALATLRMREPSLERPFRVPGGLTGACLLGVGPLVLLCVALARCETDAVGPFTSLELGAMLMALGPLIYAWRRRAASARAAGEPRGMGEHR